jgi:hypothetical protein
MTTPTAPAAGRTPARLWQDDLKRRIICSTPALETVTTETADVIPLLHAVAKDLQFACIVWDSARGFRSDSASKTAFPAELQRLAKSLDTDPGFVSDPLAVLRAIRDMAVDSFVMGCRHAIFCLVNFYEFFEDSRVRQEFENLIANNELSKHDRSRPIHIVQSPYAKLGFRGIEAVRHLIEPMPLPLPDVIELREGPVQRTIETAKAEGQDGDYTEPHLMSLASACIGLSRFRAEAQLYYAATRHGSITPGLAGTLSELVAQELASAGTLEIVKESSIIPPEDLAGVDRVLAALDRAAMKYTDAAKAQHLDQSKGIWCCGLEGSGKSATAGAASKIFERKTGRPWKVIRVKMPAFYGGLYGETETNWYDFESRISAIGECILIFDEFEKVFGGVSERNTGSGVEKSLFGLWLTWMSDPDKRGQAYPILAMNDPTGIPPEALRAGRLDAGFYFALPDAKVRTAIAKIHFAKRLRKIDMGLEHLGWSATEWEMLGEAMTDYLPGEIETLVSDARDLAFNPGSIVLPTFNQTMKLVTNRRDEIMANPDSAADHMARMNNIADLERKCRAKGARPVHVSNLVDTVTPAAEIPRGRPRLGLPRDGLN